MITALFLHHSKRGSFYPVGGASEIPYHIIPVIQKTGGKVLVKAPVSRILVDKNGSAYGKQVTLKLSIIFIFYNWVEKTPKVLHVLLLNVMFSKICFLHWTGVTVKTTEEEVEIRAPVIISNAGLLNTFYNLLPPEIRAKPGKSVSFEISHLFPRNNLWIAW